MNKIWSLMMFFISLVFSTHLPASQECLISNLRFDQNMRLYDFVVIEPDFFYVTGVVGYKKVEGRLLPAAGIGQEFKVTEKGYGFKTTYTTDKTLSQESTSQGDSVLSGVMVQDSYAEKWELTINSNRKPVMLKRDVIKNDGSHQMLVCNNPKTEALQWYSIPFRKEVVEYNQVVTHPTVLKEAL